MSVVTDFSQSEGVFWSSALSISQWKLEIALLAALQKKGGEVDYNTKLLDFEQDDEGVTAKLYDTSKNETFQIRCQYLVGCDGVKSTVRKHLNIQRVGRPYKDFFIIADLYIKNFNYALDKRYTFSDEQYHMHFAHLGDSLFRVFVTYYEEFVTEAHNQLWVGSCQKDPVSSQATLAWFQQLVNQSGLNFELYNPIRFSSYAVFLGYAEVSRKGRVFLAGDAAHSHSPHGGQGMNTGVMDSHNLGWKLAHTVLGTTKPLVLDSYADEREPVWHQLIKKTDSIKAIAERRMFSLKILTDYIFPILPKSVWKKIGKAMSMLTLNYRQSPISQEHCPKRLLNIISMPRKRVVSGDRMPNTHIHMLTSKGLSKKIQLHSILFGDHRLGDYAVLYFNPQAHIPSDHKANYAEIQALTAKCQYRFKANTAWFYIIPTKGTAEGVHKADLTAQSLPILLDIDNLSLKGCGVTTKTLLLIRPDGYVAYRNQPFNPDNVMAYFQNIFLEAQSPK